MCSHYKLSKLQEDKRQDEVAELAATAVDVDSTRTLTPLRFAGGEGAQAEELLAYLWNSAEEPHPKGPGVQWRTRATVSISEGSTRDGGVEAAGASGSGKAQARLRAGSGGASGAAPTKRLAQESGKRDGEAESSFQTRKARGKTLGRHVSAARRPDPESG